MAAGHRPDFAARSAFRRGFNRQPPINRQLAIRHHPRPTLALAERADLQVGRLLGLPLAASAAPAPATQPATPTTTLKATSKPAAQEELQPWPTREEITRAVQAERIAEEDADVIPHLTARQRDLIRLYASLPAVLPDGPIETWNSNIDPNAPLSRWREVLLPHRRTHHTAPDHDDPDDNNDPDPTPPSSTCGKPSGNKIGNAGNDSGNPNRRLPHRRQLRQQNRQTFRQRPR